MSVAEQVAASAHGLAGEFVDRVVESCLSPVVAVVQIRVLQPVVAAAGEEAHCLRIDSDRERFVAAGGAEVNPLKRKCFRP
jgi:hypothetical protein